MIHQAGLGEVSLDSQRSWYTPHPVIYCTVLTRYTLSHQLDGKFLKIRDFCFISLALYLNYL